MKNAKPKLPPSQVGQPPRVNLLPASEVGRRERRRLVRNWLLGIVATLAVLTVAVVAAFGVRMAADLRLAAELQRTEELTIEQTKYTEVAQNVAARSELGDYRSQALSNDLAWAALYSDITAVLPGGVSVRHYDLTAGAAPVADADPKLTPGVSGTITCRSTDAADQRAAVVALRRIDGALAVDAGKLSWVEADNTYEFDISFVASQSRYTGRFAATGGVK